MRLFRELDCREKNEPTDICLHPAHPFKIREIPTPEWRKETDNVLECWVTDGKQVLQDVANVKMIGEPHQKAIQAIHWMPKLEGMPEPKLPEKSAEEAAYEKFISERYHIHTLSPGEAKTAGAAWCAAIEFMKEQMVKRGMEHIGQAIIDSGKK